MKLDEIKAPERDEEYWNRYKEKIRYELNKKFGDRLQEELALSWFNSVRIENPEMFTVISNLISIEKRKIKNQLLEEIPQKMKLKFHDGSKDFWLAFDEIIWEMKSK